MKITKLEAIELRLPDSYLTPDSGAQNALVIKIHTDEGITGIGEVDSCGPAVKASLEASISYTGVSGLAPLLIGENPLDIRVLNEKMYQASYYYGRRGLVLHAMAGVDIALWDIAGKFYNVPIYKLLGGAFHKKIRAYASILFGKDGKETLERGKKMVEKGFRAVKFGWGPMGKQEKLDLELVEGARQGVGKETELMIDAGCCWDTVTAIRRSKQFEPYEISWLEEPLAQDNLDGYRILTQVSPIPIAAGEGESGRFSWRELIEIGQIHIAQIDLARNGFTEAMRIADMAEDRGLRIVNHFYSTGINLAASLHFLASRKTSFICEYSMEENPLRWEVTKEKMEIDKDGYLHLPEGAGLGVQLNEETIETYRVK